MTFRDFILSEAGTKSTVTGLDAAGRAGQSPVSSEKGQTSLVNPNPAKIQGPETLPVDTKRLVGAAPSPLSKSSLRMTKPLPNPVGSLKPRQRLRPFAF